MRSFTLPLPTLSVGFVTVLAGYASSVVIIWQAATSAGATPGQIAGWMTAPDLAMGISVLAPSGWHKVPILAAWSTSGAALSVGDLQGIILAEAVGVFISTNALIVLCGIAGLFARLMKTIPCSLATAVLAGILLRSGLQAFAGLQKHLLPRGDMLAAWLLCKALWPRFVVVAALVVGVLIVVASRDVFGTVVPLAFAVPEWIAPQFTPALLLSVGLPFFLVTMTSQNAPGLATLQVSGYTVPVSVLLVTYGGLALLLALFRVCSICVVAVAAVICQSPGAHSDPQQRWLAAMAVGGFYLLAGLFSGSIIALMSTLSAAWIQMLADPALLGTIGGSLLQVVHQASERGAAVLTSLVTTSGVTLVGIGSIFWDVVLGGVSYGVLSTLRRPQLGRCQAGGRFHPMAEMADGTEAVGRHDLR